MSDQIEKEFFLVFFYLFFFFRWFVILFQMTLILLCSNVIHVNERKQKYNKMRTILR